MDSTSSFEQDVRLISTVSQYEWPLHCRGAHLKTPVDSFRLVVSLKLHSQLCTSTPQWKAPVPSGRRRLLMHLPRPEVPMSYTCNSTGTAVAGSQFLFDLGLADLLMVAGTSSRVDARASGITVRSTAVAFEAFGLWPLGVLVGPAPPLCSAEELFAPLSFTEAPSGLTSHAVMQLKGKACPLKSSPYPVSDSSVARRHADPIGPAPRPPARAKTAG
mmetsp:Transcript_114443/g.304219  ORF Transcript_114443/g.304219 Transcript_114443/m.304219 type:complete len:217 (+) Transcript_114443:462-1112(+)